MKKSKTQMTKAELIDLLKQREDQIKMLQSEVDSMNKDRIVFDTIVADQDVSELIGSLSAKIKSLESKVATFDQSNNGSK